MVAVKKPPMIEIDLKGKTIQVNQSKIRKNPDKWHDVVIPGLEGRDGVPEYPGEVFPEVVPPTVRLRKKTTVIPQPTVRLMKKTPPLEVPTKAKKVSLPEKVPEPEQKMSIEEELFGPADEEPEYSPRDRGEEMPDVWDDLFGDEDLYAKIEHKEKSIQPNVSYYVPSTDSSVMFKQYYGGSDKLLSLIHI